LVVTTLSSCNSGLNFVPHDEDAAVQDEGGPQPKPSQTDRTALDAGAGSDESTSLDPGSSDSAATSASPTATSAPEVDARDAAAGDPTAGDATDEPMTSPEAAGDPEPSAAEPSEAGAPEPNALRLTQAVPTDGAKDVSLQTKTVLDFNRAVQAGKGSVSLREVTDDLLVISLPATDSHVTVNDTEVTIDWATLLRPTTQYAVVVDADALKDATVDLAFSGLLGQDALTFTTRAPAPLTLKSSVPEPDAVGVARGTDIVLTFDDAVVEGPIGEIALIETESQNVVAHEAIVGNPRLQLSGSTLSFNPALDLDYGTTYAVTLEADAVRSATGGMFAGLTLDDQLTFTTEAAPAPLLQTTVPADDATKVDPNTNIVLNFDQPVTIGTGTIHVYDEGGALFEEAPVDDPRVTITNSSVTIDLDAALLNSTAYYVNVDAGAIVSKLGAAYPGITDPTTLSFETSAMPPPPLTLIGTTPANEATHISPDTEIVLLFSESVLPGSGNVTVFRASDANVFASIPIADARVTIEGDSVTVQLGSLLQDNTRYYVTVGAGAFTSAQGATFAGALDDSTLSFTTDDPFVLVSKSPLDDATNVSPNANLSLTFSAPVVAKSGNLTIWNGNTLVETIAIAGGRVQISNAVVTIDPTNPLAYAKDYSVTVDDGALGKVGGQDFPGISGASAWNFTTISACDSGETRGPNGDCYFFAAGPATWDVARRACDHGTGWDLASVKSSGDQTFIQGLISGEAWLGGTDSAVADEWRWIATGEQFWQGNLSGQAVGGAYEHWKDDQPSGGDQHCMRMLTQANSWLWADAKCDEEYGFVCQGPAN
jgi:hypothetical protein